MIAVLAVGCVGDDFDGDVGDGAGGRVLPPAHTTVWRAELTSVDPFNPRLRGHASVTLVDGGNAFTAKLTISDDLLGGLRRWHVNVGTCATGGPIVGDARAYPRFYVGNSGEAAAIAVIRAGLDLATPYHVSVHESNKPLDKRIACGALIRQ